MKKSPKRRPFAYLQVAGRTGHNRWDGRANWQESRHAQISERSASRSGAASHNYVHQGKDTPRTL